jgi:hypothetical protein
MITNFSAVDGLYNGNRIQENAVHVVMHIIWKHLDPMKLAEIMAKE